MSIYESIVCRQYFLNQIHTFVRLIYGKKKIHMATSKLFRTLASLSPKEFSRFDKYVHSPFFSQHADTIAYFDFLRSSYPEFKENEISNDLIFSELYPGESFDDNRIRTLKKYLLKLVHGFLVQLKLEKDTQYHQRSLLLSFLDRKLPKDFRRVYAESEELLNAYPFRDEQYYYDQFFLRRLELHDHLQQENRLKGLPINRILSSLNKTYIIQQLNYSCAVLSQKNNPGAESFGSSFLDSLILFCKENYQDLPVLAQAYYLCFLLLSGTEMESTVDQLEQLLNQHQEILTPIHMQNLYKHAINYCNSQYLTGQEVYLKRMFELYRQMLQYDLLFEEQELPTHHYKNIVTLGLRLGELDWTEEFIDLYKETISPRFREGVYHYNMAHLYSYREIYGQALRHLQKVDFIDPFYRISYNMLLLKIYYECKEVEPFLALAQSFRTYIRRRKELPPQRQLSYTNFASYLRAIFMIKIGNKHNLPFYKQKVETSQAVIEKGWLLQKIQELEEKKSQ